MHTNQSARAELWLAGWFTIYDEGVTFVSCHRTGAAPWPDAAAWLRDQLHQHAPEWEPTECTSMHVAGGQALGELAFPDCLQFITWALANRQGRGVWGQDADRWYYLIHAEDGEGATPAVANLDITPPMGPVAPVLAAAAA